jgi:hypothetical protein
MRGAASLLVVLVSAAACSSQPAIDRQSVPDRPEVQRPEGVEPEGLTDMRNELSDQRGEARARENAAIITPNAMGTHPTTPWYETALNTVWDALRFFGL